ncbi:MAG: hypothetical protein IPJ14_17610 [Kineosporiaceae bacterium]|nr:hypothetical protein [Kineosporiaceae bacterium]MBK7624419.1 hypothetical protein [Kineosporiaceae bacterium]MBK8077783.1 hypothetical protein [Kineosporiaceae bacterium]
MAIAQLTDGGIVPPSRPGPLHISATGPATVRIDLVSATGEPVPPAQRVSDGAFIVQPSSIAPGSDLTVVASPILGGPFPPGSMVGLTITHPSMPLDDLVLREPVDASGRSTVQLVTLSVATGSLVLRDAFRHRVDRPTVQLAARSWHETGGYAYHAAHAKAASPTGPWAMVIDGSATMLAPDRRTEVGRLIEVVFGIAAAARDGAPKAVLRTRLGRADDITARLDTEQVDWVTGLGDRPSPWAAVLPAVKQAASAIDHNGLVVVVVDGVPLDAVELVAWAWAAPASLTLQITGIGRSPFEASATHRPMYWWDNEFEALAALPTMGRHTLVTVSTEAGAAAVAKEIAMGMFSATVRNT